MKLKDLTGSVFGKLTVVRRAGSYVHKTGSSPTWECACECGKTAIVRGPMVAWGNMRSRCTSKLDALWKYYGGLGVKVCDRWHGSFEAFLADVGRRPSAKHSIDRFPDENGDYEPGNVRWATDKQQADGNRRAKRCARVTMLCGANACNRRTVARGVCSLHYERRRRLERRFAALELSDSDRGV